MTYNRAVHTLHKVDRKGRTIGISGENGSIILSLLREGVYRVTYHLDQYGPEDSLVEAAESYFDPDRRPGDASPGWDEAETASGEELAWECGRDRLSVGRKDGVITVRRDGKVVHGGTIGTDDTVLPRYPLRVLGGTGDQTRARLNFRLHDQDRFFGLGDKTGGLNKRGQRYHMYNRDALGYNAAFSDPLYKSIPFVLKHNGRHNTGCGLFFPVPRMGEIDLGRESNYYFSVEMTGGPFSYVLFTGDTPWEILERYTWLTGRPSLPPLFTFGFLGSSMNYTEPDDADQRVSRYFDRIEENRIPCEGFYFSSGYVKADNGERYTFEWNKHKFPDPAGSIGKFRERGYHIACNIKPGFLVTHPRYAELDRKGYFIKDTEGCSYKEYYWGNNASFLDFANPEALAWWKKELKEKFLDYGVSGIWNDNNEFELEDRSLEAQKLRPLYPVLMSKASWEVMREVHPGKRPWVISRSGSAGIQKYARTWSGDNVSDWVSMKYNTLMGIGLGLSGVPYYGHDIGGFFGDQPDEKQFIRWCQSAVFQPRFVIHSWNMDGNPTEVWSYPESIGVIRELVELHYEFMPAIYNAAIEASLTGLPLERPLALMFPEDPRVDPDGFHYMFGEDILVLSAVEEGEQQVACYLPAGTAWYDPATGETYKGGRTVVLDYPYEGVRYLIRRGGILFRSPGCRKLETGFFPSLEIGIIPAEGESFRRIYREDNGEDTFQEGSYNAYAFEVDWREREGRISLRREASAENPGDARRAIELTLPEGLVFTAREGAPAGPSVHLDALPEALDLRFHTR